MPVHGASLLGYPHLTLSSVAWALRQAADPLGYSLVELFKRAQFGIDVGLSPTFEELNCSFGH